MVDNRTLAVLMELFATKRESLYELSIQTGIDKHQLQSNLELVNQLLQEHSLPQLQFRDGEFLVSPDLYAQKEKVFSLFRSRQIYLSQEERPLLIYLYTFIRRNFIANSDYQELLSVSRNTTLTDIKSVKELCLKFQVGFDYSRAKGYHLLGREKDKHRLALYAISRCLQSPIGVWALDYILQAWGQENPIEELKLVSQQACQVYQVSALEGKLDDYLYFLIFFALRQERTRSSISWDSEPSQGIATAFLERLWQALCFRDKSLLELDPATVAYLSHLLQGCLEGEAQDNSFYQLTLAIVEEMERLSLVTFDQRSEMIAGLQRHLIPAYYRLTSRVTPVNSYTETIKEEHADLFYLVKKALRPLEEQLGCEIPDSEISYFVIHFGGYLEAAQQPSQRYQALVVCPNGVSSSLIVKENLRQLFPNIYFADSHSIQGWEMVDEKQYDMVFGTVKVDTDWPFFLVSQVMTASHKKELFHLVNRQFPNAAYFPLEIEQLLALIGQHATIHQEQTLKYELVQFLNQRSLEQRRSPMLEELLTAETFQRSEEELEWQAAIALAAQPLLDKGAIHPRYIDAMVRKVEEFGPFIDLGKGIAIPHARPEDGVQELGMSLLVLDKPVYLLDDPKHPISLLICIAAIDNHTHLRALSHLTKILRDPENISQLVGAQQFTDIQDLLKEEQ